MNFILFLVFSPKLKVNFVTLSNHKLVSNLARCKISSSLDNLNQSIMQKLNLE